MVLFFLFFFCCNALFAQVQNKLNSVPASIQVKNPYNLKPVEGVRLTIQTKGQDGRYNTLSTHKTDSIGGVVLSLLPNKTYSMVVEQKNYYTQVRILSTSNLNRIEKNKYYVSLRPKDCFRLRGKVLNISDSLKNGYLEIVDLNTKEKENISFDQKGTYQTCGKCGHSYSITPYLDGKRQSLQEVTLLDKNCSKNRNPLLLYNITLDTPKVIVPVKKYVKGDSIVLKGFLFGPKSETPKEEGNKAMDTLAAILNSNSELKIELRIHTDSKKSTRFNRILAEKRCTIIERYLQSKGVPNEQFFLTPIGEGIPLKNKKGSDSLNSRVELFILDGETDFD